MDKPVTTEVYYLPASIEGNVRLWVLKITIGYDEDFIHFDVKPTKKQVRQAVRFQVMTSR